MISNTFRDLIFVLYLAKLLTKDFFAIATKGDQGPGKFVPHDFSK